MIQIRNIDTYIPEFISEEVKLWVDRVIKEYKKKAGEVFFLFCSDEYLLEMNQKFLQHDFYTDIITFSSTDVEDIISGEMYISLDRVKENADTFGKTFQEELHRVMIHGILHLIGYKDKSESEEDEMRQQEEKCLLLRLS